MRRLLNKRGSVLFLVVVVMSILIIAASATYYIVNNQHSSINVRYSSEQSYQTALSVSDTVSKYIDGYLTAISKSGNELDKYKDTIVGKMLNISGGSSVDITSELNMESDGMGTAKVVIKKIGTRTDGKNTIHIFDIETASEVNGETVKIVQRKEIVSGPAKYFTRFLTSTGGDPRDVLVGSYKILSDSYFENDFTSLGVGGAMLVNDSLYSSGTLVDDGISYNPANKPELVVAENFYITKTAAGGAGDSGFAVEYAYIGGNFENGPASGTGGKQVKAKETYVLGDYSAATASHASGIKMYVGGDCHIKYTTTSGATFYINGDLYLNNTWNNGTYYVSGDVYLEDNLGNGYVECGGNIHLNGFSDNNGCITENTGMAKPFSDDKIAEIANKVSSDTSRQKYQEWDAEQYFTDKGITREITLDDESDPAVDAPDYHPEWSPMMNKCYVTIDESCKIHPAQYWGNSGVHDIIIDTTAASEELYIWLEPNPGSSTFSFTDGGICNVFVKGPHAVIFIIPDGVNFQMDGQSFIGHFDLAKYFTGVATDEELLEVERVRNYINDIATAEQKVLGVDGDPAQPSILKDIKVTETLDDGTVVEKVVATAFDSARIPSTYGVHNNIFFVTKGKSNVFDFSGQSSVCGYIYAPNSILKADGAAPGLAFMGGLIVGSYSYRCSGAVLTFTTPYDYYGLYTTALDEPTDIVQKLINKSKGVSGDDIVTLQDWSTAGYK